MEAVAEEVLPPGYTFAWSGLAYEEKQSGGTSGLAFVFGLIIVFLVLAAQYESWTLPGAVMTAVPFGILGALLTNHLRGLDNDVYFQIGLLVLIGLGAKNAVLRVSAAVDFRKQGKSIMEATILAGEQRLRPIIMTSLAFAIGCLPLALAVGAGANARHSIGTGIIGGMLGETTLAMLYVPLLLLHLRPAEGARRGEGEGRRRRTPPEERLKPPTRGAGAARGGRLTCAARLCTCSWCSRCGGCMVGPDYTRPAVDAPAAFIYEAKDAADTANTAVVEAVRRPGARRAHRRRAREQPQRQGGRRQRRAGRRRADADAVADCSRRSATAATAGRARSTEAGATPELAPAHPQSADRRTRRC